MKEARDYSAIDIIDGKCVINAWRLQKKIYNEHPLEVAKEFEDAGMQRLHLVDLDGAKAGGSKKLESVGNNCREDVDGD